LVVGAFGVGEGVGLVEVVGFLGEEVALVLPGSS
jgi:hypothetical protein